MMGLACLDRFIHEGVETRRFRSKPRRGYDQGIVQTTNNLRYDNLVGSENYSGKKISRVERRFPIRFRGGPPYKQSVTDH